MFHFVLFHLNFLNFDEMMLCEMKLFEMKKNEIELQINIKLNIIHILSFSKNTIVVVHVLIHVAIEEL